MPAIASTFVGWHPAFAAWLRGVVCGADEVQGSGVAGGAGAVASGLLFRVAASLAEALHHGNFGVLVASAPDLGAAAGRLALPLGEDPEVWRAAPGAAVDLADDLLSAGPLSCAQLPARPPLVEKCLVGALARLLQRRFSLCVLAL